MSAPCAIFFRSRAAALIWIIPFRIRDHRCVGHEYPGVVPGISFARGAATSRMPSSASGEMSVRCSMGKPCACTDHANQLSSGSTLNRSAIVSASAFWRASCVEAALSSASLAVARGDRLLNAVGGKVHLLSAVTAHEASYSFSHIDVSVARQHNLAALP